MENELVHSEHSNVMEDKDRGRIRFLQVCGLAAILTGVLTIFASSIETAGAFLETVPTATMDAAYVLSNILALVAFTGVYIIQRKEAGLLNLVGYLIILFANILMVVGGAVLSAEQSIMIGGSLYALGGIIIGIATLKAGLFPRWIPMLWILTPVIGLPGFILGGMASPLLLFAGSILFSIALVGAGAVMWKQ
jgi:hypothetical protein